jgi:hypothetical protein
MRRNKVEEKEKETKRCGGKATKQKNKRKMVKE